MNLYSWDWAKDMNVMEDWVFKWDGIEIRTNADMYNAIKKITSKNEANKFLEIGSKHQPYLIKDIEYFMGYLDKNTASKIWEIFKDANMNAWYRLGVYEGKKMQPPQLGEKKEI